MKNVEKLYICKGENYTERFRIGFCGDIKTLNEWLECLFGNKKSWFEGDTHQEIIDYIYKYCGKRLERFKGGI